ASAMMPPICLSLLAEMVPTCAIISPLTSLWSLLISSTATSTAFSMPRLRAVGLAPAATVFTPSRKMACASTVAVVVPSPATSEVLEATSRTICAPMFSSASFNSISLATVTPSLVMTGAPNFFSITALRPLGPRVIFTASARAFTPRKIAWREFSPVTICFAISPFLLIIFELRNPQERARVGRPATTAYRPLPARTGSLGRAAQLRQDLLLAPQNLLAEIPHSYNLLPHFSIPPDNLRPAKPQKKSTGRKPRHYSLQTTTCANRQPWPRRSASPGSPPREGSGTLHLQSLFP